MPFRYVRDDIARRISLTVTDPLTIAEMIETVDRQLADGAWSYATFDDARTRASQTKSTDVRMFVAHVRQLVAAHGSRGPIAIAARAAAVVAGAQMYSFKRGTA